MADVNGWVSDKLHDILGLSDKYTAEFLVGTAKKSSSEEAFLRKLKETGVIEVNSDVSSFARELWGKIPRKKVTVYNVARDKEKAALVQQQKNKSYRLLPDEGDTNDDNLQSGKKSSLRKEREKKDSRKRRNIRKEKASAWESESEEEEEVALKRSKNNSDSDEWEKYVSVCVVGG